MNDIQVKLLRPTEYGRLYYRRNPEIEPFVLFLHNNFSIKRNYSINIDSAIILDINENQILQGAEFIIHRKVWLNDPRLEPPPKKVVADIEIINLSDRNELLEAPVRAITDGANHYVFFSWGSENNDKKWVSLSDKCYALISGTVLTGFFIFLVSNNED